MKLKRSVLCLKHQFILIFASSLWHVAFFFFFLVEGKSTFVHFW